MIMVSFVTDVTDDEEGRGETRPIAISRRSETLSEPYQIEILTCPKPAASLLVVRPRARATPLLRVAAVLS